MSLFVPSTTILQKVILTDTQLFIITEYAPNGQLFDRVMDAGRLSESEARKYFAELVSGVGYCHMQVCLPACLPLHHSWAVSAKRSSLFP
jgi:serine/threonine protein kinase